MFFIFPVRNRLSTYVKCFCNLFLCKVCACSCVFDFVPIFIVTFLFLPISYTQISISSIKSLFIYIFRCQNAFTLAFQNIFVVKSRFYKLRFTVYSGDISKKKWFPANPVRPQKFQHFTHFNRKIYISICP